VPSTILIILLLADPADHRRDHREYVAASTTRSSTGRCTSCAIRINVEEPD